MEETTYKINHDPIGKCICGHTASAHGRKGMICCACECKQFKEGHSSIRPVASRLPQESHEIDSNGVIILQDGEKKS